MSRLMAVAPMPRGERGPWAFSVESPVVCWDNRRLFENMWLFATACSDAQTPESWRAKAAPLRRARERRREMKDSLKRTKTALEESLKGCRVCHGIQTGVLCDSCANIRAMAAGTTRSAP
jgi:hypothetical protein